ncbi:MAG: tetratricopeptide repeat protein [Pseudomonadota bacterium]
MPAFAALVIAIQLGCAYHAVRNRADTFWIYLILFAPGLGCAIYVLTQVVPGLTGTRTVRRARSTLINTVDPKRELRRRTAELEAADTVQNRMNLADECIEAGLYDEAVKLLEEALSGLHKDDPGLMERLAVASFGRGDASKSKQVLDALIAAHPDYRSPEAHLLYARSLEALDQTQTALDEYEALHESYPGEEGRVRYGLLLKRIGQMGRARQLFSESLRRSKHAPAHYRRAQRDWLNIAKQESE